MCVNLLEKLASSYKCSHRCCDFELDVLCALLTNTSKEETIETSTGRHAHPLIDCQIDKLHVNKFRIYSLYGRQSNLSRFYFVLLVELSFSAHANHVLNCLVWSNTRSTHYFHSCSLMNVMRMVGLQNLNATVVLKFTTSSPIDVSLISSILTFDVGQICIRW